MSSKFLSDESGNKSSTRLFTILCISGIVLFGLAKVFGEYFFRRDIDIESVIFWLGSIATVYGGGGNVASKISKWIGNKKGVVKKWHDNDDDDDYEDTGAGH